MDSPPNLLYHNACPFTETSVEITVALSPVTEGGNEAQRVNKGTQVASGEDGVGTQGTMLKSECIQTQTHA